jgi:ATP-dependent protease ClpP protease subunit
MKNKLIMLMSLLGMLLGVSAQAIEIKDPTTGKIIKTDKVTRITAPIQQGDFKRYSASVAQTVMLPGERVIILNSPGGDVTEGQKIINLLELERAMGVRMICIVDRNAHSMAFNILTHCDVRMATEGAGMVVHKCRTFVFGIARAKELRRLADAMDKVDEPYRRANSKAMKLTLKEYDKYADAETNWKAVTLLARGYLHGLLPKGSVL